MSKVYRLIVAFVFINLSFYSFADEQKEQLLLDIFNPNSNRNFSISPNGSLIAHANFDGKYTKLFVFDPKIKVKYQLLKDRINSFYDFIDYFWVDDKHLVVSLRNKLGQRMLELFIINEGNDKRNIVKSKLVENYFMFDSLPMVPNKMILGKRNGEETLLYKLDLTNSKYYTQLRNKKRINRGVTKHNYWLSDSNGHISISHQQQKDGINKIYYRSPYRKSWELVYEVKNVNKFKPALFDQNSQQLYFFQSNVNDESELYSLNVTTKQLSEPLYRLKSLNYSGVLKDKRRTKVLGVVSIAEGVSTYEMLDNSIEQSLGELSKELSTNTLYIIDSSLDGQKSILVDYASNKPGSFYLFDKTELSLDILDYALPNLKDASFQETQVFKSKTSDGVEIESYFTPSENHSRKMPLIVMPHGGPHGVRDYRYFDRTVQSLSKLGYSVLQVNYRGSSGYGKEFLESSKKQWGKLIEEDIATATKNIISKGLANEGNICIFGISYGGYSALMSSIKYPELYSCAISYAGVTDLVLLFSEHRAKTNKEAQEFYLEYVGNPNKNLNELKQYSPVYRAKDIKTPIMISHGGKDTVVDLEHYFRLASVLDALKIPYKKVFYKREVHGFDKVDTQVDFLIQLSNFVEESLSKN